MSEIVENYRKIRNELPDEVDLIVSTKTRNPEEIRQVIEAGAEAIGENYTHPEATGKYDELGKLAEEVEWHLIGHLQKNDINKALPIFDVIQTVESTRKARHIDKRVEKAGKSKIPVYIEVNSAREENKYGVEPEFESLKELLDDIAEMDHLEVKGLMTMGAFHEDPEDTRPYFKKTKKLFEKAQRIERDNLDLQVLSMGMSNSYRVAIEEGANVVRLGRAIFGPRE